MIIKKLLLPVLLVLSCKSPQKYIEQNKYEKAYSILLRKLHNNKQNNAYKESLNVALDGIIAERTEEKRELINSDLLRNLEKAIRIDQYLQKKITKAHAFTENRFENVYDDLMNEVTELKKKVSNGYLQQGEQKLEQYLATEDKHFAKDAYFDFQKSKDYGMSNRYLDSLLLISCEYAQVIYSIEVRTPYSSYYDRTIDQKFKKLEDKGDRFTKVYYNTDIPDQKKADCNILITFSSLDIDYEEQKDEENFEKEVVIGKEWNLMNDSTSELIDKTQLVKGIVVVIKKKKTAEWKVKLEIDSETKNCDAGDKTFTEKIISEIEETVLEGDRRAIPINYSNGKTGNLRSDDDMAKDLIDELYKKISSHLF